MVCGSCFGGHLARKNQVSNRLRRKRRCYPAAGESEIIRIQMQPIMLEQLRPGHPTRFKIIPERSALADGQGFCDPRASITPTSSNSSRAAQLIIAARLLIVAVVNALLQHRLFRSWPPGNAR